MKHYEELKTLRQRPNQSVGDFLALFGSIEHQLQNEMPDWIGKLFILTGVHPHLKDGLRLNGRLGRRGRNWRKTSGTSKGWQRPPKVSPPRTNTGSQARMGPRRRSQTDQRKAGRGGLVAVATGCRGDQLARRRRHHRQMPRRTKRIRTPRPSNVSIAGRRATVLPTVLHPIPEPNREKLRVSRYSIFAIDPRENGCPRATHIYNSDDLHRQPRFSGSVP